MNREYDVAIIGGGIAGSALAVALADEGARVLVAERAEEFKDRVRGEWLAPWGAAEARMLGLSPVLEEAGAHALPYNISRSGKPRALRTAQGDVPLAFHHVQLQEALLRAARDRGVAVERPVVVDDLRGGARPGFRISRDGLSCQIDARLVVGAEGRSSLVRRLLKRPDYEHRSERLLAGVRVSGLGGPEDTGHFLIREDAEGLAMVYPQGDGYGRAYVVLPGSTAGDFRGEEGFRRFVDFSIESGISPEVMANVEAEGPLAAFRSSDRWLKTPYRDGLAVVGDAAGVSDPTWGMGISLALRDARTMATALRESEDPQFAAARYARLRDRYYQVIRTIENWQSDLLFTPGQAAAERRRHAVAGWSEDGSRVPDLNGVGPDLDISEGARMRFFGEDRYGASVPMARPIGTRLLGMTG